MTTLPVDVPSTYRDTARERCWLLWRVRCEYPELEDLQVADVRWCRGGSPTRVELTDDGTGIATLPETSVSPAAWEARDGAQQWERLLRARGRTLASWDPTTREAYSMRAGTFEDALRQDAAALLGVRDPWQLRVRARFGPQHIESVELGYEPGVTMKAGGAALAELIPVGEGGALNYAWDPQRRIVTFTWKDGTDPLKGIFALDASADGDGTDEVPVITIGMAETGELLTLDLTRDAAHIAMQGMTRSGKSVATYNILATLAPSRAVDLYGIDPSGILLAPYAGTRHGDRVALGTQDPARYVEVLKRAVEVMDRRTAELGRTLTSDKLENFSPEQPLLLVVCEEMPGIVKALRSADTGAERGAPKTEAQFKLLLGRLLAEGAKVGVRCLLIAQRFDTASAIDGSDRANLGVSVTFRVKRADAVAMLHEELPEGMTAQQVGQFAPGVGLYESPVTGQDIVRFRAPLLRTPEGMSPFAVYAHTVRRFNPPLDDTADVASVERMTVDLGQVEIEWDMSAFELSDTTEGEEY